MMNIRSIAALAVVMPTLTTASVAETADYTCWNPSGTQMTAAPADYWTAERLADAVPDGESLPPGNGHASPQLKGLLGAEADRAPIDQAPYKYGGKLFFTRGGIDYSASAQFVADDNIVLAAGHSMWKNGSASNIRFYPGYAGAPVPFHTIDKAAVLTAWLPVAEDPPSLGRSQYDYSMLRTTTPSTVGKYQLGINTANLDDDVTITGYPGRLEGGEYMYRETARIFVKAGDAFDAQPHPMYGGGASGGAWFLPTDTTKVVSVVSGGAPDHVYGASFTDVTTAMVAYVKGGCK
jgi:hypothetical protein